METGWSLEVCVSLKRKAGKPITTIQDRQTPPLSNKIDREMKKGCKQLDHTLTEYPLQEPSSATVSITSGQPQSENIK
jgi:hypothetical protein